MDSSNLDFKGLDDFEDLTEEIKTGQLTYSHYPIKKNKGGTKKKGSDLKDSLNSMIDNNIIIDGINVSNIIAKIYNTILLSIDNCIDRVKYLVSQNILRIEEDFEESIRLDLESDLITKLGIASSEKYRDKKINKIKKALKDFIMACELYRNKLSLDYFIDLLHTEGKRLVIMGLGNDKNDEERKYHLVREIDTFIWEIEKYRGEYRELKEVLNRRCGTSRDKRFSPNEDIVNFDREVNEAELLSYAISYFKQGMNFEEIALAHYRRVDTVKEMINHVQNSDKWIDVVGDLQKGCG